MAIPLTTMRDTSIFFDDVTDDERVAAQTSARVLISGATSQYVAIVARRVHMLGDRERFPFVEAGASALPPEAGRLTTCCAALLDAAAGGSMLLSDVEEMSPQVQEHLIELLARLAFEREPSAAVRLISGTTVSLLDRVVAGAFSARLFYQLNVIHIEPGRTRDAIRVELHNVVPAAWNKRDSLMPGSTIHAGYGGPGEPSEAR
jgi:DNA-binding NtrC family response regulator